MEDKVRVSNKRSRVEDAEPLLNHPKKNQKTEHQGEAEGSSISSTYDRNISTVIERSQERQEPSDRISLEPRHFQPPTEITVNWREVLRQFLGVSPGSDNNALFEALESTTERIHAAEHPEPPVSPTPPIAEYQIIHRIRCSDNPAGVTELYLDAPWMVHSGPQNAHLRGSSNIPHLELHLERHKELSFVVYKDYSCCGPESVDQRTNNIGASPITNPAEFSTGELTCIVSEDFSEALDQLAEKVLNGIPYPEFQLFSEFSAPYLWWFHRREQIQRALPTINPNYQRQIHAFSSYIQNGFGETYRIVDALLDRGQIMAEHLCYLYVPGQILLSKLEGEKPQEHRGYLASSWLLRNSRGIGGRMAISGLQSQFVKSVSWGFDGYFQQNEATLAVDSVPSLTRPFDIRNLKVYPLEFASTETKKALRTRGEMFWMCRKRKYVCCNRETETPINALTDPRFMIDIATYKKFHSQLLTTQQPNRDDLGLTAMSSDKPPLGDEFILCLPSRIPGYHMQKKEWLMLPVGRIVAVEWNVKAFETLVVSNETKELVTALVKNQIAVERGTDLMSGKGNGLFILLHGGPGTGKTLTAESVAEIAQKPLYRVTCGDIGTNADEVEKYLETVLLLGKIWGCVVLLDEADIFLEQRVLNDFKRNALVSVFLRVLEYYDGILILTSNRVATFDEAFKSRIQLSLRYNNLGYTERLKVWQNFIDHLDSFPKPPPYPASSADRPHIDYGIRTQEIRDRLPDFAREVLNGREIRNVITTVRQLAMFRTQPLGCEHLNSVILEARKFEDYLKEVRGGHTADELKRYDEER